MISAIIKSIKTAIEYSYSEPNIVKNGNFNLPGVELVTNGDFSATGNDLVTDGNFSATGTDLLADKNGNFESGSADWSVVTDTGSVTFANDQVQIIYTTTAAAIGITQAILTEGKNYKIVIDVASISGSFKVMTGSEIGQISTTGVHTLYGVATGTTFYIYRIPYEFLNVVINSVTVEELGQNWTLGTGWSIGEDKAICDGTQTVQSNLFQTGIVPINKSYKAVFNIVVDAGGLVIGIGGSNEQPIITTTGTYTLYSMATTGDSNFYFAANASFVGSVTNLTVKEVGQNWNLGNGWSVIENKAKWNADSATQNENINQSISFGVNKSYKVTFTIGDVVGSPVRVLMRATGDTMQDITNSWEDLTGGTYTRYFYSLYANTQFDISGRNDTGDSFSITNITVKEVGQDWTVGAGWSIGDQKLIANDPTENTSQSGVFESGVSKYYKINLKVSDYTSGSFKVITSGNTAQSQTFSANDDFEFELLSNNPTGTDLIFSFDGDFIGSISEVSVKERITESPELTKVRTLCNERVYALKQADGANTPCVIVQLVGCEPNHTKDGGSSTEVNEIEITCIASHPRTAFQMAALLRMGFNKSKILTDKNEGVTIDEMIFLNWASDVFEPTDMYTMTLRFEAFSSLRQDLTNYL